MKKILAIISLALVIATLACLLSSCGAGKLKGTWKDEDTGEIFEFKSGGKGKITYSYYGSSYDQDFTYKVKGSKVMITVKQGSASSTVTFKYKVSGKTLTMTGDNGSQTFMKVK